MAEGDQNRQIHPFIKIGLDTSMRKTEIFRIRREHINLQQLAISPKPKQGRVSNPLPPTSVNTLLPMSPPCGPVNNGCFRHPLQRKVAQSIWTSHFAAVCQPRGWMSNKWCATLVDDN